MNRARSPWHCCRLPSKLSAMSVALDRRTRLLSFSSSSSCSCRVLTASDYFIHSSFHTTQRTALHCTPVRTMSSPDHAMPSTPDRERKAFMQVRPSRPSSPRGRRVVWCHFSCWNFNHPDYVVRCVFVGGRLELLWLRVRGWRTGPGLPVCSRHWRRPPAPRPGRLPVCDVVFLYSFCPEVFGTLEPCWTTPPPVPP